MSLDPDPGDEDDVLTQNGYTYTSNNPVNFNDPDGRKKADLRSTNSGNGIRIVHIGSSGGSTKSTTSIGREVHKKLQSLFKGIGRRFRVEVSISGYRIDVVDYKNKIIYEIKPNNARAIRDGKKQLEKYRKTISKKYPGKWKMVLITY